MTTSSVLTAEEWPARRRIHENRVAAWIDPHLARTAVGEAHPVYDFLFTYYSHRPAHLRRWHPGVGVTLTGPRAEEFLSFRHYRPNGIGVTASPESLEPPRFTFIRWLRHLLETSRDRAPFFGCAGLHEWAMLYRTSQVRHSAAPLRLGAAGTAAVVDSLPVRCSHFDAFRFFTPAAQPLNRLQPVRERASEFEQPGCLHANMDLYKWAYKLTPFTPAELVADAFALARDIREIDMRASPYDLQTLGFSPICVETAQGRAEYETHQRIFANRSQPIRDRLIAVCRALLDQPGSSTPGVGVATGSNAPVSPSTQRATSG